MESNEDRMYYQGASLYIQCLAFLQDTFECKRCGKCCCLDLQLMPHDVRKIAKFLKISVDEFKKRYVWAFFPGREAEDGQLAQRPSFGIKQVDGHCPFLKDGNFCTIYENRPEICRVFPFLDNHYIFNSNEHIIYVGDKCPHTAYHASKMLTPDVLKKYGLGGAKIL